MVERQPSKRLHQASCSPLVDETYAYSTQLEKQHGQTSSNELKDLQTNYS